jgi:hypothetical protein
MRRKQARFALIVLVLALTAHLSPVHARAQGRDLKPAAAQIGIPYNRACLRRCRRAYRRCLRRGVNSRACYVRLRNCLRHCPQ